MARIRASSAVHATDLTDGWSVARLPAGTARTPDELEAASPQWVAARVPGSAVADFLRAGQSIAALADLDEDDVWYRCTLPQAEHGRLRLSGLATICELFLDGRSALSSQNMFREHEVALESARTIHLRFASVAQALREKRPRPRWKVRLVREQQLRWLRTSLQGRMPGWSPAMPMIGPVGGVELLRGGTSRVASADVRSALEASSGVVQVTLRLREQVGLISSARLRVGAHECALELARDSADQPIARGTLRIENVERWWPHTHGAPRLYAVRAEIDGELIDLGSTGFRSVTLDRTADAFRLSINGEPIFCAGALWTPTLLDPASNPRPSLQMAVDAGMNMIRIPGFANYGDARFFAACDELGLLVWQDFMFCNLDYPGSDAAFAREVSAEAEQFLSRTQLSPSLAILAGSSEVPQQVAMLGLEPALAQSPLFDSLLPNLCAATRADVPYCNASAIAARVDRGPSHYYGVGGYRQPLTEARRANVQFASECLAFSNVPREENVAEFLAPSEAAPTAPSWKSAIPRDVGSGWDHEDVRDHYLRELFRIDPVAVRWSDPARWMALSRVVPSEIMRGVIAEFRRPGSSCAGALVLGLRDAQPGAGYGVLDSSGIPKASYWALRRAFAPLSIFWTDEGLNGLALHVTNQSREARQLELKIALYRDGETSIAQASKQIDLPPGASFTESADALFGRFVDAGWTYRFGPLGHNIVHAQAIDRASGALLGETHHFPGGLSAQQESDLGFVGEAAPDADGAFLLTLRTRRFAQFISIGAPGFLPSDDFFHLAPGAKRTVRLRRISGHAASHAIVEPLNSSTPLRIALKGEA